jgi:uncharacterized membrane protein YkvA (DUF1232 family)
MKGILKLIYNWYGKHLRTSKYRWLVIIGSLLYLITPLDISPDFLPMLGWLDDGMIATILITDFSELVQEYRNRRKKQTEDVVEVEYQTNS